MTAGTDLLFTRPQADAPNASLIPPSDVTGVTVVLLTCSYRGHEFVRVGYYVNNEYDDEQLRAEPPATPLLEHLTRNILADKPRVTRFPIRWDAVDELEPPPSVFGADGGETVDEEASDVAEDSNSDRDDVDDGDSESVIAGSSPEHQMIVDSLGTSSGKSTTAAAGDFEPRFSTAAMARLGM